MQNDQIPNKKERQELACSMSVILASIQTVKMFVNGKENAEFENYLVNDKDKIEIRYE